MEFTQILSQKQNLVLSQEMKQSLQVLAMTLPEMQSFLSEQLKENPLLEEGDILSVPETEERQQGYSINTEPPFFPEGKSEIYNSLEEYLLFQLNVLPLSKRDNAIGKWLLGHINDDGLFSSSADELSTELGLPKQELTPVLNILRRFDPPGVCCFGLKDCLIMQLNDEDPLYDETLEAIRSHLDIIAENNPAKLAKAMNFHKETADIIIKTIKGLNPHPGASWGNDAPIKIIIPDVTVSKTEGKWQITLEEWNIPTIAVSSYYHNMLRSGIETDEESRAYLKDKLAKAQWIINAIEQRRKTITRSVESILRHQAGFFDEGNPFPAPLNLKDVAEDIGVHESTVSRALSNKYIQTPRGLFQFKYFFPKAMATGSDFSQMEIKSLLRQFISDEDSDKPLRDGILTDMLKEKGISISRRTVAKYREEMNIPIAGKRKIF